VLALEADGEGVARKRVVAAQRVRAVLDVAQVVRLAERVEVVARFDRGQRGAPPLGVGGFDARVVLAAEVAAGSGRLTTLGPRGHLHAGGQGEAGQNDPKARHGDDLHRPILPAGTPDRRGKRVAPRS
jgi:hypothetical protein